MIALNPFRRRDHARLARQSFAPQLECLHDSAGVNLSAARPLADLRLNLEALEERLVPAGIAATAQNDASFVLLQSGQLWEHVGTDSSKGWYYVWSNVKQVSAGVDSGLHPAAFVLFNDGTL